MSDDSDHRPDGVLSSERRDNWYHTTGPRFYEVSSRNLANGEGGGGNVQLHKPNNSNSAGPASSS